MEMEHSEGILLIQKLVPMIWLMKSPFVYILIQVMEVISFIDTDISILEFEVLSIRGERIASGKNE